MSNRIMRNMVTGLSVLILSAKVALAADISVFAAASLTESLRAAGKVYEGRTHDKVSLNFAASGTLARQIAAGAPADVFFSADEASANTLENKGCLVKGSRTNRLSNLLVVVVPADSAVKLSGPQDLTQPGIKRIALGDTRSTPVGVYAREYLATNKVWDALESRIIPVENVRAVLAAVETGNVDAGIVYKTDAAISGKVRIALEIPCGKGPAIRYPMALVKSSGDTEAARKFLDFLLSAEAGDIFKKFGFVVLE